MPAMHFVALARHFKVLDHRFAADPQYDRGLRGGFSPVPSTRGIRAGDRSALPGSPAGVHSTDLKCAGQRKCAYEFGIDNAMIGQMPVRSNDERTCPSRHARKMPWHRVAIANTTFFSHREHLPVTARHRNHTFETFPRKAGKGSVTRAPYRIPSRQIEIDVYLRPFIRIIVKQYFRMVVTARAGLQRESIMVETQAARSPLQGVLQFIFGFRSRSVPLQIPRQDKRALMIRPT